MLKNRSEDDPPFRLVLDTNIVVSAALKPDQLQRTVLLLATANPAPLYGSVRRRAGVTGAEDPQGTSPATPPAQPEQGASGPAVGALQVTKDPDDNKFLECADAARADYLVTRNLPKLA